jgi:hypothetical protein
MCARAHFIISIVGGGAAISVAAKPRLESVPVRLDASRELRDS